jgi:plasmid stability protein
MANLTLSLDDDLLRRARMRALELDTTVNAMVRDYLAGVAGENPTRQALTDFLDLADQVSASSGPDGHDWSREDLYER